MLKQLMLRMLCLSVLLVSGCGVAAPGAGRKTVTERDDAQQVDFTVDRQGGIAAIKLNATPLGTSLADLEAHLARMAADGKLLIHLRVDKAASQETIIKALRACSGTTKGKFVRHAKEVDI